MENPSMSRNRICKATPRLIPAIRAVFKACIAHIESQGIIQWHTDYPAKKNIEKDIERGELHYIGAGKDVWAVITINEIQDPQYQGVTWSFEGDKILVVHRLAVHPAQQGKGLAQQLMNFAEDYARQNGYAAIRLDAYEGNPRSQNFYHKMGYLPVGYVQFDYQPMRCVAFEKAIKSEHNSK